MRGRVVFAILAFALMSGGAAGAVATSIIQARSGDQINVNKNLGCYVGPSDISCAGAAKSRIDADVRSNGQIVILVRPTPHGVYPLLYIDRAACTSSRCKLVDHGR